MKFQSFVNFPKKKKNAFILLIFYLLSSSFFFSGFIFYEEALCFIIFILSLCSNMLNLENILILKFNPGMKCLHVFFSFCHPRMKFHPCLSSQDEFIPGWNFISAETCKQWETFYQRQGWFHPGSSFIPGWNFTCKHPLRISNCRSNIFSK